MTDETLGDGFTMSPPTNAKDRVFAAVTRRANTLFQEMIAASATEQGTATIEAFLAYLTAHDLAVDDLEVFKRTNTSREGAQG